MTPTKKLAAEISAWPQITVHPHRFGGTEFCFGDAEVGHVHAGGTVDIPFPRPIRDALLAEGFAEEHRWVPNSGWTSFHMRSEEDFSHALWLMRLSYLRYYIKTGNDPRAALAKEFEEGSDQLQLSSEFKAKLKALLEQLMPAANTAVGAQ